MEDEHNGLLTIDLPFLEENGLDLHLSESASITPRCIIEKQYLLGKEKFDLALECFIKEQNKQVEKEIKSVSRIYEETNKRLMELDCIFKQTSSYDKLMLRLGASITEMKTAEEAQSYLDIKLEESFTEEQKAIRSKNKKLNNAEKKKLTEEKGILSQTLDNIKYEYDSLVAMKSYLGQTKFESSGVIALKTYRGNGNYNYENDNTVVKRFALIAENLCQLTNYGLVSNTMHPLEKILLQSAFSELDTIGGVIFDIFVRTVDQKIAKCKDKDYPETHSVVLWREQDQFFLLDPSSSTFSSKLVDEIGNIVKKSVQTIDGVLYGTGEKNIGRNEKDARDCIDIAVKIILELYYQTNIFPKKDIKNKIKDTFCQLSTEPNFAKHLVLQSKNRQLREFTSASSDIRHLALRVANSVIK